MKAGIARLFSAHIRHEWLLPEALNRCLTCVNHHLTKDGDSFAPATKNGTMYHRLLRLVSLLLLASISINAQSTDTLRLSLPAAEQIFLKKNLSLLAQQYNADISKALAEQARYWDNPILNTDQNIYDGKFFRHNKDFGQVYIQLQQVIRTAGKRNKQVQLANDNVLSAQQQFNDMMRNLRFILRSDYSTLHLQLQTLAIYKSEIESLQKLVLGMDAQFKAGNISQKDNIRVKALLYSLQTETADLQRDITDTEKELAVLLQVGGDTVIVPVREDSLTVTIPYTLSALLDTARMNRPDIQLAQTNLLSQQHNLLYQRALVKPDITVGVEYDQRSSYVTNFWGLGLSVPLPILNRNKGNIKAASLGIAQANLQVQQVQNAVERDVITAYHKLVTLQQLQQSISPSFMATYNQLMKNMVRSYQDRQVGLLEFIDFFDAYKDAASRQLQQASALAIAAEELNYSTGTTVITLQ
ncbi:MAG TPA: TolC family protein [Chitinophagaceae bacterium]|nr:TolC family protein [Chitinophagaceae bacterium]